MRADLWWTVTRAGHAIDKRVRIHPEMLIIIMAN